MSEPKCHRELASDDAEWEAMKRNTKCNCKCHVIAEPEIIVKSETDRFLLYLSQSEGKFCVTRRGKSLEDDLATIYHQPFDDMIAALDHYNMHLAGMIAMAAQK